MAPRRSIGKVKKPVNPSAKPAPAAEDANYLLHIQSTFDSMPKSYQKVANFLLESPDSVKRMSITQFSDKLGVCPSTITRFCQSLGFSGFPQLKYDIAHSVRLPIEHDDFIDAGDSTADITRKLSGMYAYGIESITKLMDLRNLDLVADIITKATKIYLFGHGGSGISVSLGQLLFMQIGLPATGFIELSTAVMAATQLREGDIAIGISSSGVAKTAVDALRQAEACGAVTVGITGYANSPLGNFSKILFCYNYSREDMRLMHVARICETAILGLLQNCILNKHYDMLSVRLAQAKEAIMHMRYI